MRIPFIKTKGASQVPAEAETERSSQEVIAEEFPGDQVDPQMQEIWESLNTEEGRKAEKKAITRRKVFNGALGVVGAVILLRACVRSESEIDLSGVPTQLEDGARNYAAALIRDWYTWDVENLPNRGERLKKYNPDWGASTGISNVTGNQTVVEAWAIGSKKKSDHLYTVTVATQIQDQMQVTYAEITIYATDKGFSPTTFPALVAAPEIPIMEKPQVSRKTYSSTEDTQEIASTLEVFFKAWGSSDSAAIKTTLANGYSVAPILTEQTFKELSSITFTIDSESDAAADRPEIVYVETKVLWELPSGTWLDGQYQFEMRYENSRWLIARMSTDAFTDGAAPTQ